MSEAVIDSTARTGLGKSYRGALNHTDSVDIAGHVIRHAAGGDSWRLAGVHREGVHQPLLQFRSAGYCHRHDLPACSVGGGSGHGHRRRC